MSNSTMREIQMCTFNILKEVIRICNKHKLTYYLSCGTLLGAVRHKGFIPWDNDIDIEMPIEDYRKFLKIAPKEISGDFFIQTYKSDPKFNLHWIQVRANNTTSLVLKYKNWDIHWGMHIDIFPLIGLYENTRMKRFQLKSLQLARTFINKDFISVCMPEELESNKKLQLIYKLPKGIRNLFCDLFLRFAYKGTKHSKHYSIADGEKSCINSYINSSAYNDKVSLEFEGLQFDCPGDYDHVLTELYGDYMTPPPESERHFGHTGTHGSIIYDHTKDYKEYLKDQ